MELQHCKGYVQLLRETQRCSGIRQEQNRWVDGKPRYGIFHKKNTIGNFGRHVIEQRYRKNYLLCQWQETEGIAAWSKYRSYERWNNAQSVEINTTVYLLHATIENKN